MVRRHATTTLSPSWQAPRRRSQSAARHGHAPARRWCSYATPLAASSRSSLPSIRTGSGGTSSTPSRWRLATSASAPATSSTSATSATAKKQLRTRAPTDCCGRCRCHRSWRGCTRSARSTWRRHSSTRASTTSTSSRGWTLALTPLSFNWCPSRNSRTSPSTPCLPCSSTLPSASRRVRFRRLKRASWQTTARLPSPTALPRRA
mmetsp:Transcript_10189/g.41482  ORF Transcript_10189/g.41482 Transcript_10189/m.41482 type:complete len:205 (+) Transcript_10189:2837-3451(+)